MQHVNEECQILKGDTDSLQQSSQSIAELAEPAKVIEQHLDESTKIMGNMAKDAFYMLDNQIVLNCLNQAVSAHQDWLGTLKEIAETGILKVLQTDCTKCGLGHFYYALKPIHPDIAELWAGLDGKHKTFHAYGTEMISAVRTGRTEELLQIYREAESCSQELLSDFQTLARTIETLTEQQIRILLFPDSPQSITPAVKCRSNRSKPPDSYNPSGSHPLLWQLPGLPGWPIPPKTALCAYLLPQIHASHWFHSFPALSAHSSVH